MNFLKKIFDFYWPIIKLLAFSILANLVLIAIIIKLDTPFVFFDFQLPIFQNWYYSDWLKTGHIIQYFQLALVLLMLRSWRVDIVLLYIGNAFIFFCILLINNTMNLDFLFNVNSYQTIIFYQIILPIITLICIYYSLKRFMPIFALYLGLFASFIVVNLYWIIAVFGQSEFYQQYILSQFWLAFFVSVIIMSIIWLFSKLILFRSFNEV